jgi:hypothetical protein
MCYIASLDMFSFTFLDELATDVILLSLPLTYKLFILIHHMGGIEKNFALCQNRSKVTWLSVPLAKTFLKTRH